MKDGYRADIDGLRAIAVASVLLFHLGVLGFSGGYVGVDVFFVISGYLITGYIHPEIASGKFSLREFYLRRVRRLGPALLLLSVPVAFAAWFILYPEDLRSFATSLGLQFAALQNVVFLAEGEYFRGAETKPLLHTWSLAVEEQFYLVWPLLLLFTRRASFGRRMLVVGALMLGSFLLNLALFRVSPKASFFLLPPRAWEMGAGGIVALIEAEGLFARWLSDRGRATSAVLGLAAIVASVLLFDDATPFPGRAALLPVVGSVLVIVAGIGGAGAAASRLLSNRALVHIGLISYPLYLWHWPLIAFCHHLHLDPTAPRNALAILGLSLGLAELTYRFIETPIRTRQWLATPRAMLTASGVATAALVLGAVHLHASEGAAYRFQPVGRALLTAPLHARTGRCGFVFRTLHPQAQVCALHDSPGAKQRVLLWGNSHADMWSGLLAELGAQYEASVFLNARNCRATPNTDFCGERVQGAIFDFIAQRGVTDVILASSWYGAYDIPDAVFEKQLTYVVQRLAALGARTWLVTDVPTAPQLDPVVAFEQNPTAPRFGTVGMRDFAVQKQKEVAFFGALARSNPNVQVLDSSVGLCDAETCFAGRGETAWYRDSGHLTDAGARTAVSEFRAVFTASGMAGQRASRASGETPEATAVR
jgi:peptidoglycan/LPS O-acetylase OafA/YrhL